MTELRQPLVGLAAYSHQSRSPHWGTSVVGMLLRLSDMFRIRPTHLHFKFADGYQPRRPIVASARSLKSFEDHATRVDLLRIDVYARESGVDLLMSPLILSASHQKGCPSMWTIIAQVSMAALPPHSQDQHNLMIDLFQSIDQSIRVTNALVHRFDPKKYPALYLSTAFPTSVHLSSSEEREVKVWEQRREHLETVQRGVYWANIISASHWRGMEEVKTLLMTRLQTVCHSRLYSLGEDRLMCCAPFSLSDSGFEEYCETYLRNVKRAFDLCGIEYIS